METGEILRLLQDVAAEVITPRFRRLDAGDVAEKNPGDLVTVADREAEQLITEALAAAYPDAVVLGEETSADDPSLLDRYAAAGHAFTVDPIDGTKNFVHGSPDHAVMVAEVRDGVVMRGWIWQPQHRRAYVAERGAGAWVDGEPLVCATPPADQTSWRVVTSRRAWLGRRLGPLPPLELTWVCCGVDYPHLIAGDAAAVVYPRAKPWDHAPGSLLLTEAGGRVGRYDGSAYDPRVEQPDLLVAVDGAAFDTLVGLL